MGVLVSRPVGKEITPEVTRTVMEADTSISSFFTDNIPVTKSLFTGSIYTFEATK
jgi:hypothetical protein